MTTSPLRRALAPLPIVAAFLAASLPVRVLAQTEDEFQLWAASLNVVQLRPSTPTPSLWLDTHARRGEAGTVHILRPAFGFEPAPFWSFWMGYAWTPTFRDGEDDVVHEHRIWNQWILQHQTDFRLALQARTRMEYRWSQAGIDMGVRLRQFARVGWQPSAQIPVGLVIWDEVFVGLNQTDWTAPRGFDQNRLFGGLFLTTRTPVRLEVGYLFARLERPTGDLNSHVLAINLFVNLKPRPPTGK